MYVCVCVCAIIIMSVYVCMYVYIYIYIIIYPVSSQSCCMYVLAGRPALAQPYVGVHRSTSLMSSSLLLQQCPAFLIRLNCIVFVMGGR